MAKHMRTRGEGEQLGWLRARAWPWDGWTVGRVRGGLLWTALGGILIGAGLLVASAFGAEAPPPIADNGNGWDVLSVLLIVGGGLGVLEGIGKLIGWDFFDGDD